VDEKNEGREAETRVLLDEMTLEMILSNAEWMYVLYVGGGGGVQSG
jgi:hypothetical protein